MDTTDAPFASFGSGGVDGFDQLSDVIDKIQKDVASGVTCRRILMVAWNPKDSPYMALPPCHVLWAISGHWRRIVVHLVSAECGYLFGLTI